jgi:hydroxypyruvate isomerase
MRLAANLSLLYAQLPLEQRFDAAARDGFDAVEILLPYERPPAWYAHALAQSGLQLVLINTPVSDGVGRRGLAAVPGAEAAFQAALQQALDVAEATHCPAIHLMAGHVAGHEPALCRDTLLANLDRALPQVGALAIRLSLEALNRSDVPGYFYHLPQQALAIVRHFDSPALQLQFDFYHCVKEGLDPAAEVRRAAGHIGHAQIAGAPDRFEPDLQRDGLLGGLEQLHGDGYAGWLGCEYKPRGLPTDGLGWADIARQRGLVA